MVKQNSNSLMSTMGFERFSIGNEEEYCVLDRSSICLQWFHLWSLFGFNEIQWNSRAAKVEEHTRNFLNQTLINYKEQLNKRKQLLQQSLNDYDGLIRRVGCSSTIEKIIFDDLKLKDQEIYIDRKIQDLIVEEEKLIHQRRELEIKQKNLCQLLNATSIEIKSNLSLKQINEQLQDHIKMLNELKELRHSQISSYYIKIKEYLNKLDWTPSSSTIRYLLERQFDYCLTANDLNEIESTIHQFEQKLSKQKLYFESLKQQLINFYERLGKDHQLISSIHDENVDVSTIKRLEEEIRHCQEERMKNGNEYREKVQCEIENLLEKVRLNDEEKKNFLRLNQQPLTSELLDEYESELKRLLILFNDRQPVLNAFDKWFSFWNEFLQFNKSSTNPGRFHVRGYNAEIESRQRKKFQRELPLIEQEFLRILSEYNRSIFYLNNEPIRQRFDQQIKEFNPLGTTPAKKIPLTSMKSRTPIRTPQRIIAKKQPFIIGTALTNAARRIMKTPSTNNMKKHNLIQTEKLTIRAKPQFHSSPIQTKNILSKINNKDELLDFSLLHTKTNLHGQIKIMTSTPNCSIFNEIYPRENHFKTSRNIIGQRKSKQRSKRTPVQFITVDNENDETILCL